MSFKNSSIQPALAPLYPWTPWCCNAALLLIIFGKGLYLWELHLDKTWHTNWHCGFLIEQICRCQRWHHWTVTLSRSSSHCQSVPVSISHSTMLSTRVYVATWTAVVRCRRPWNSTVLRLRLWTMTWLSCLLSQTILMHCFSNFSLLTYSLVNSTTAAVSRRYLHSSTYMLTPCSKVYTRSLRHFSRGQKITPKVVIFPEGVIFLPNEQHANQGKITLL